MKLEWHPTALKDVDEILDQVRSRSLSGAANVSVSIERAAQRCASWPFASARTGMRDVFRYPLTDRRIAIFYKVHAARDTVEILRVVRSGRIKSLRRMPR